MREGEGENRRGLSATRESFSFRGGGGGGGGGGAAEAQRTVLSIINEVSLSRTKRINVAPRSATGVFIIPGAAGKTDSATGKARGTGAPLRGAVPPCSSCPPLRRDSRDGPINRARSRKRGSRLFRWENSPPVLNKKRINSGTRTWRRESYRFNSRAAAVCRGLPDTGIKTNRNARALARACVPRKSTSRLHAALSPRAIN